jgi:transposase
VTVADSSWPIHHGLSDKHHQTGQPTRSRPVVDLVGRTAELALIDSLLDGRGPTGPGLLLRGDPGVGKTALLDAAAVQAEAAGTRVLRAAGAEFEAEISFSALHQILYPLREYVDRLATGQRDVLHQVFGLAPGPALDPLVISAAVLALLGEVTAERPLLLAVDDVPWIDCGSATVLGFVARRLGSTPIVFLAAAPTGVDSFFDRVRLPEREVGPLAEQPAATLLDTRCPNLAPTARRRLLAEAAGNPLALRELPASLTNRRPTLRQLHLIVSPDTVLRWHRDLLRRHHAKMSRPKRTGRPPTVRSIQALVLRLARENSSWGYRRIHGKLAALGINVAPSTLWEILQRNGIGPSPERDRQTWTAFLRR